MQGASSEDRVVTGRLEDQERWSVMMEFGKRPEPETTPTGEWSDQEREWECHVVIGQPVNGDTL